MAIATLIAAGRLDDRLVERALGLLREFDPHAGFSHWIDEGDAADLRFGGDSKAARWALEPLDRVDDRITDVSTQLSASENEAVGLHPVEPDRFRDRLCE